MGSVLLIGLLLLMGLFVFSVYYSFRKEKSSTKGNDYIEE